MDGLAGVGRRALESLNPVTCLEDGVALLAEGLRRRYRKKTAIWQVVVYERP